MSDQSKPLVICAPEPRTLELIFTPEKLAILRSRYDARRDNRGRRGIA